MKATRALETPSLLSTYGVLLIVSLAADFYYRGSPFKSWNSTNAVSANYWIAAAGFVVLCAVFYSIGTLVFSWAVELQKIFAQILTPISYLQALLLSFIAGFIEEWFFRGILLHHFGLILSSIIFGLAHLIPVPRLWPWGVIQIVVGIAFGLLYESSGSLLLVATTHSAINAISLLKLNHDIERAHAIA